MEAPVIWQHPQLGLHWSPGTADPVAIIELLAPARGQVTLSADILTGFNQLLDLLEPLAPVLLLRSDASDFCAGADLDELGRLLGQPDALEVALATGQQLFNRIAAWPAPTVAVLQGRCFGGGLELALACRFRLAAPDTVCALPEVQLGLVPAWGGLTRLPRLIGLDAAAELVLTGQPCRTTRCLEIGLVDAIVPAALLADAPVIGAWARRRSGSPDRSAILDNPAELQLTKLAWGARLPSVARAGTAPATALKLLLSNYSTDFEHALAAERAAFIALGQTAASQALLQQFMVSRQLKRQLAGPPEQGLAVLGAGIMGAGIAALAARVTLPVSLWDKDPAALARARSDFVERTGQRLASGQLNGDTAARRLNAFVCAESASAVAGASAAIECVFEALATKRQALAQLEAILPADALLLTNTSSLQISELAAKLAHPERFCGLHFFNPVHACEVVEVIAGPATSALMLQRAMALAARLGKIAVPVKDVPGFFVNRVLGAYLQAIVLQIEQGACASQLERALLRVGFAAGPLATLKLIGAPVAAAVSVALAAAYPDRFRPLNAIRAQAHIDSMAGPLIAADDGCDYWSQPLAALAAETERCLDEGVIANEAQAAFVLIRAIGFPPSLGSPLSAVRNLGVRS